MTLLAAVDVGSTYTKLVLIETCERPRAWLVEGKTDPTDVDASVAGVLHQAGVAPAPDALRIASSAGGGLRIAAVGYVASLTAWAAREVVLGSGARLSWHMAGRLQSGDIDELRRCDVDLVLLSGGTDGGDTAVLLHNARMLGALPDEIPVVVAGNRDAAPEAAELLGDGRLVEVASNVLPRVDDLNPAPARTAIHVLFNEHVILGRGLERLLRRSERPVVPTPAAVLAGAEQLATSGQVVVAVDVGGATVDVHSVGACTPPEEHVVMRPPIPPDSKRTVEADIGIREGLDAITDEATPDERQAIAAVAVDIERSRHWVARSSQEHVAESTLARIAIRTALKRHSGSMTHTYTPSGKRLVIDGKDLRCPDLVVGVGGVFRHGRAGRQLLASALIYDSERLTPRQGELLIDRRHLVFAIGLWSDALTEEATRRLLSEELVPAVVANAAPSARAGEGLQ